MSLSLWSVDRTHSSRVFFVTVACLKTPARTIRFVRGSGGRVADGTLQALQTTFIQPLRHAGMHADLVFKEDGHTDELIEGLIEGLMEELMGLMKVLMQGLMKVQGFMKDSRKDS